MELPITQWKRGFFNPQDGAELDENERALLWYLKRNDINAVHHYVEAQMVDLDNFKFRGGNKLTAEVIKFVKRYKIENPSLIKYGEICDLLKCIAEKYPNSLNSRNDRGENALDIAIQSENSTFIDIFLRSSSFVFSTKYVNNFIDIIIRSGRTEFLTKAIKGGLDENQAPALLKYVYGKLAEFLRYVSEGNENQAPTLLKYIYGKLAKFLRYVSKGNQKYCVFAKNCSDLMIILSDWMVLEANTRNEKKLIDAIASFEEEKIDKLLRKIRDINYQDRRGRTFLIWAVTTLNLGIVNAILAKDPDISLADDEGKTALDHAMENPDVRIREAIIAAIN